MVIGKEEGRIGLGAVIRDHNGNLLAARSVTKIGIIEPIAAEAMAAILAFQLSSELGVSNVWLEGDANMIVKAVESTEVNWSHTGHLIDDIRTILRRFPRWRISHVGREFNQAAYGLARLAKMQSIDRLWRTDYPECIRGILIAEKSAMLSGGPDNE